jgi:hypothetical protein
MNNPVRKAVVHVQGIRRYASPLSTTFAAAAGTIRNIVGRPLLENPPWVHATWVGLRNKVVIAEKDQAIRDKEQDSSYPAIKIPSTTRCVKARLQDPLGCCSLTLDIVYFVVLGGLPRVRKVRSDSLDSLVLSKGQRTSVVVLSIFCQAVK